MQKIKCRKIAKGAAAAFIAAGVLVAGCRKMPIVQKKKENGGVAMQKRKSKVMDSVPRKMDRINIGDELLGQRKSASLRLDDYVFTIDASNGKLTVSDKNNKVLKEFETPFGMGTVVHRLKKGLYVMFDEILGLDIKVVSMKNELPRMAVYHAQFIGASDSSFIQHNDSIIGAFINESGIFIAKIPVYDKNMISADLDRVEKEMHIGEPIKSLKLEGADIIIKTRLKEYKFPLPQ